MNKESFKQDLQKINWEELNILNCANTLYKTKGFTKSMNVKDHEKILKAKTLEKHKDNIKQQWQVLK